MGNYQSRTIPGNVKPSQGTLGSSGVFKGVVGSYSASKTRETKINQTAANSLKSGLDHSNNSHSSTAQGYRLP